MLGINSRQQVMLYEAKKQWCKKTLAVMENALQVIRTLPSQRREAELHCAEVQMLYSCSWVSANGSYFKVWAANA